MPVTTRLPTFQQGSRWLEEQKQVVEAVKSGDLPASEGAAKLRESDDAEVNSGARHVHWPEGRAATKVFEAHAKEEYDRSVAFCNPKENKKAWERHGEKEAEGRRQMRVRWDYLEGHGCTEAEFIARKHVHPDNKERYDARRTTHDAHRLPVVGIEAQVVRG